MSKNEYGQDIEQRTKILQEFADVIKGLNTRFFLCHGTLLGAIRDNALIPWDVDIDIDVLRGEFRKERDKILRTWEDAGYEVHMKGQILSLRGREEPISIHRLVLKGDQRGYRRLNYPAKFWSFPRSIWFLERRWWIPHPVMGYLDYCYKDWRTPIKTEDGLSGRIKRVFQWEQYKIAKEKACEE